jgi:hypothetical protein
MIGLPVLAMSVMFEQVQSGKGFLIKTNGDVVPFYPTEEHEGSKVYDMDSVRKSCNFDNFELAYLNDNMMFICDEEGLYRNGRIVNLIATKIFQNAYESDGVGIVGDCVICRQDAVK